MISQKDNLYQIPKGWVWTEIGEIGEIVTGNTPSKKNPENYGEYIPFVKPPQLNDCIVTEAEDSLSEKGAKLARILPPKSLLVSCIGILGKTGINKISVAFNQQINAVILSEYVVPEFGFYYFQTSYMKKWLYGIASATTIPIVNKSKFSRAPFPIASFPEQSRIVGKVEELFSRLDAGVEWLGKAKAQLQRYRQAVLTYAFEGKLTEEWRKTHEFEIEPTLIKNSHRDIIGKRKNSGKRTYGSLPSLDYEELPAIPTNWIWVRFEEVIYVIDYRGRTPPFCSEGIPHLRSSNIRDGKIIWENMEYVSEEIYQKYMVRGFPQKSDLLFTTEAPLGEVAFIPDKKFSIAQRVILLRPNKDLLNAKFLYYQLMSERFRRRLVGKGTGTTVTGVSYRNLRQIELSIPPLGEQERIVEEVEPLLSMVDEAEKVVNQSLIQSGRLRQSILKKAFEGRLVPQNPTDEPAEKLLECIIEEKRKSKEFRKKKSDRERGLKQLELVRYVK